MLLAFIFCGLGGVAGYMSEKGSRRIGMALLGAGLGALVGGILAVAKPFSLMKYGF